MNAATSALRLTFNFALTGRPGALVARQAAWDFMRRCGESGTRAGFPVEGDEFSVTVLTKQPKMLVELAAAVRTAHGLC